MDDEGLTPIQTDNCPYEDCCGGSDMRCDHVMEQLAQLWFGEWISKLTDADVDDQLRELVESHSSRELMEFFSVIDVYMEIWAEDLKEILEVA